MTTLTTFEPIFPPDDPTPGARLTVALLVAEATAEANRARIDHTHPDAPADAAAHAATTRILGPDAAAVAVWIDHGDGTATGVLDDLAATWAPPDGLRAHRHCAACDHTTTIPVVGLAQLVAALAQPSCSCQPSATGRWPR